MSSIVITTGDPAGIGPDITLDIACHAQKVGVTALGCPDLLQERAKKLGLKVEVEEVLTPVVSHRKGVIPVMPISLEAEICVGQMNVKSANYVLEMLKTAVHLCQTGQADAMVTAPLNKAVINEAGLNFSGHTEYLAELTNSTPVMMLAAPTLKVALVTTHLPLSAVSKAITRENLIKVIDILHHDLQHRFGIESPRILVAGLNPHAGESGHMGREEIDVIEPVLEQMCAQGMNLIGPLPADTLFTPRHLEGADAVLAMYHDQGLPVLKYVGFGEAINITLGLSIIRTSVDHGTAYDLAGSGRANAGSLQAAIEMASVMIDAKAALG